MLEAAFWRNKFQISSIIHRALSTIQDNDLFKLKLGNQTVDKSIAIRKVQ